MVGSSVLETNSQRLPPPREDFVDDILTKEKITPDDLCKAVTGKALDDLTPEEETWLLFALSVVKAARPDLFGGK